MTNTYSSIGTLAPELVHRTLSFLSPTDVFSTFVVSSHSLADALQSTGPLWSSWLDTFFGLRADVECTANGFENARRLFLNMFNLKESQWCRITLEDSCAPSCREWFVSAESHTEKSLGVWLHGGRECRSILEPRDRGMIFGDLWYLEYLVEEKHGAPTLRYGMWNSVETTGQGPGARAHHDGCVIGSRYLMIHGGLRPQGYRDNDTFLLDLHAEPPKWYEISPGAIQNPARPTARFHHSFTRLRDCNTVVIFGGHDRTLSPITDAGILTITPTLNLPNASLVWELEQTERQGGQTAFEFGPDLVPSGRARHSAAPLGANGLVIFGGNIGYDAPEHPATTNDLWFFNVDSHTWTEIVPSSGQLPSARQHHSSFTTSADVLIVCGGCDERGAPPAATDLCWTLDLSSFVMSQTAVPPWQLVHVGARLSSSPFGHLKANLIESRGYTLALGGYSSGAERSFDHFGDPISFADCTGLPSFPQGFLAAAAANHESFKNSPIRSVGNKAHGQSSKSKLRSCGVAKLGDDAVILATDVAAKNRCLSAFCLRLAGFESCEIGPGALVEIKGLQKRPELNGERGTFVQYLIGNGRCQVRLSGDSGKPTMLSVQLANLRCCVGVEP